MKRKHLAKLEDKVLTLRKRSVLLDRDLADALDIKTSALNQTVTRNEDRFGKKFCFSLKESEVKELIAQGLFTKKEIAKRTRPPRAFTEAGAYMVSFLIPTKRAIKLSRSVLKELVPEEA
ncbi:MAG: ORF6N domain-containing protein [Verrucomicrobiota bacterium JB023]|nr:ORF6N domain-containing protein [Verrucomicrobiota bacterium JB023]